MKRLFILIVAWLAVGTLSAQNLTRCEYWLDQNYGASQEVTLGSSTLQFQVDATGLNEGLHSLNLHIQDATGTWSSPRSFLFLHYPQLQSATGTYTYWFDNNEAAAQSGALTNGMMLLDASALTAGPHFLTLRCQVGTSLRIGQYLFLNVPSVASANATYKYWFDDNTAAAQSGALTNGNMMLNASALPIGMHTLNLECMVGTDIRVEQHLFYKMPTTAQSTAFTFHYRIDDGDFQTVDFNSQGGNVALTLDLSDIAEGTHTIDHYVTNGANSTMTIMQTDTFERPHVTQYFTLTVLSADASMGTALGSNTYEENSTVSIEAVPNPNYHFTNWNDNNTENPRDIVLTSDTTFTAYFAYNEGVEDYSLENIIVYTRPGTIMVSVEIPKPIWVYDMQGRLVVYRPDDGSTTCTIPVSSGTYIVKLGDVSLKKVVVTE